MEKGPIKKQVTGTTRKIEEGKWEGRIWDGWYVAFAKTQKEAQNKVTEKYYKDQGYG